MTPFARTFLGVRYDVLDLDTAAAQVAAAARRERAFRYVVTPNSKWIVRAHRGDARARTAFETAWLSLNDSRIVELLAREWFGFRLPTVTGSDLVARLFERSITPASSLVLVGGSAELEARLRRRFGVRDLRRLDPPMGLYEDDAALDAAARFVCEAPADYVFLICGMPQAEMIAERVAARGDAGGVGLCVGAAIEFLVDLRRRAPPAWRRAGLEWLHRLIADPRGHARRVFVESLPVLIVAAQARWPRRGAAG
ncbi:WecB/TagA/CpsF family glycosyltransferase [Phenylobacterium sp. VNQ135]|uniref:WecB/TagA/CpsF family glycosyltransferase n=1 Tax=Phenylobacterium sp. VNQ135 TaxID=3400922 RepID=UPI003C0FFC74